MSETPTVKIGCCGFATNHATYYRTFSVVEIQQTFYQLPQLKTAERWRAEAPNGFEFTMKAWQLITHEPTSPTYRRLTKPVPVSKQRRYGSFKPTEEVLQAWEATRAFAQALGVRIVVFQCPASFTPVAAHVSNLRHFFRRIDRGKLLCCWEPRGHWDPALIRGLCRELDLDHCVDPFVSEPVTRGLRYFRLHGRGGYHYRYTDGEIARLARLAKEARATYVLFNNVAMLEDARRLLTALLGRRIIYT